MANYGKSAAFAAIAIIIILILYYIHSEINRSKNCPALPSRPITTLGVFTDNELKKHPLNQVYIKTAYNCCCKGNFRNDYVDVVINDPNIDYCALRNCALNGARALDFTVYSLKGKPIISASTTDDISYKEQYNYLDFNLTMQQVSRYFLSDSNTSFIKDPLFLIFRIQSDKKELYNSIANCLTQTFGAGSSLTNKIYANPITGNTLISAFNTHNVVIMVQPYNKTLYEESQLSLITSYMFNPDGATIPFINHSNDNIVTTYGERLLVVFPDIGVSSSANFNPTNSFINGVTFIGMNFQSNDRNLIKYNKQFKNKSIVLQTLQS